MKKPISLGIFVTHPVQYHVPIWRILANDPDFQVKVHYFSDHSVRGGIDPGFGVPVSWDTPLLKGYDYEFISTDAPIQKPLSVSLPNAWQRLKTSSFDWIFIAGYTHRFEMQILQFAPMLGSKVILRGELTDLKRTQPPLLKKLVKKLYLQWVYQRVDVFGCVGQQARHHLKKMGIQNDRIHFSPYSVDTPHFESQMKQFDRRAARKELGYDDDTFVFLYSGKLIPRKEILCLIKSFQHIPDDQKASLLVLGDGEQKNEVLQLGNSILRDRFSFQGFVNQSKLGKYFIAADAFVLPSHYEAWGLVVNEAMQFGLPLILSDMIGCHEDLLLSGETGYLFKTQDEKDLAVKMQMFMRDPDNAKKMGQRAKKHIQSYSVQRSAQGIKEAILSGSKTRSTKSIFNTLFPSKKPQHSLR